jgi:hypothetical protein
MLNRFLSAMVNLIAFACLLLEIIFQPICSAESDYFKNHFALLRLAQCVSLFPSGVKCVSENGALKTWS